MNKLSSKLEPYNHSPNLMCKGSFSLSFPSLLPPPSSSPSLLNRHASHSINADHLKWEESEGSLLCHLEVNETVVLSDSNCACAVSLIRHNKLAPPCYLLSHTLLFCNCVQSSRIGQYMCVTKENISQVVGFSCFGCLLLIS